MTGIRKRKNKCHWLRVTWQHAQNARIDTVPSSSPLDRSPMSHYSNRYFYRSAWINLGTYKRSSRPSPAIWRVGMLLRCPPDWTSWYVNQDRRKPTLCGEDERQDIGGWLRRRGTVNCEPSCCESVARQEIAVAW